MTGSKQSGKKQRDAIDEDLIYPVGGILLIIQIAIFIVLFFITAERDTKILIVSIYSIILFPILYFIFAWYFNKNDFEKKDLDRLENVNHYGLYSNVVVYLVIPIVFSILLINSINMYLNNELINYVMENLKFHTLTDFIVFPGDQFPGANSSTSFMFILLLITQFGYTCVLPSIVAREFKFYQAEKYFSKANNAANPKKITFFIK